MYTLLVKLGGIKIFLFLFQESLSLYCLGFAPISIDLLLMITTIFTTNIFWEYGEECSKAIIIGAGDGHPIYCGILFIIFTTTVQ